MAVCSVKGCRNRTANKSENQKRREINERITFHKFPRHPETRQKWINAINRPNFVPTQNSHICSEHFSNESFKTKGPKTKLLENAVPLAYYEFGFSQVMLPEVLMNDDNEVIPIPDPEPVKDETNDEIPKISTASQTEPADISETSRVTIVAAYEAQINTYKHKIKILQQTNRRCQKRIQELKTNMKRNQIVDKYKGNESTINIKDALLLLKSRSNLDQLIKMFNKTNKT